MTSSKSVSNEDILELLQESMQMISDGFQNQEAWNQKQGSWNQKQESWNEQIAREVKEMRQTLSSHDAQFAEIKTIIKRIAGEQKAQVADISEILDRIQELEQKKPTITKSEKEEMQSLLQQLLDWAELAAKNIGVPLKV